MATLPKTDEERELYRQFMEVRTLNSERFQEVQANVTKSYEDQLKEMRKVEH